MGQFPLPGGTRTWLGPIYSDAGHDLAILPPRGIRKRELHRVSHRLYRPIQIQPENCCVTKSNRGRRTRLAISRRRRSAARIQPTLDYLEARTLLTAGLDQIAYLVNPPSEIATVEAGGNSAPVETASTSSPVVTQETLDVQLHPDASGALSQLMPLLAAAGAMVQLTSISGLYEVSGASRRSVSSPRSFQPVPSFSMPVRCRCCMSRTSPTTRNT